jgi:transforming growth factor-beta-induced protein
MLLKNPFARRGLAAASLALTATLVACDDSDPVAVDPDPDPTIAAIVAGDPAFSTLLTALEEAGLTAALDDENATFTVFAPSNDAFGPLDVGALLADPAALESVLLYHVVATGALSSSQLSDGQRLTTLAGEELLVRVNSDGVFVDGSQVVTADVEAENGIVHVIDRTLTGSRNLAGVAAILDETSSLLGTVVAAGLADAFVEATDWTVFAPNNTAFELAAEVAGGLSTEELQAVLQYHVLPSGVVDSATLLGLLAENDGEISVETAQGEALVITQVDASTVVLNNGQATLDLSSLDFFASNGILHIIDGVLLPPSFDAEPVVTIADVVAGDENFSTLLAALEAAELVPALADPDATFTVFAPTNDAFGPLNVAGLLEAPEALEAVLLYHVVAGAAVASGDLSDGQTVTTLQGGEVTIRVSDDGVFVDGVQVTTADIQTDNGIIHVIDRTLVGSLDLAGVVGALIETEALLGAVVAAGLAQAFVDAEDWTVFAPDNAAFEAVADVTAELTTEELQAVLQYHVLPSGVVDSGALLALLESSDGEVTVTTAQGEDLQINLTSEGSVVLNNGQATLDLANLDYLGSNGIVHLIDGVLLPPSFAAGAGANVIIAGDR